MSIANQEISYARPYHLPSRLGRSAVLSLSRSPRGGVGARQLTIDRLNRSLVDAVPLHFIYVPIPSAVMSGQIGSIVIVAIAQGWRGGTANNR
ncbi:MAG: hypothetical protein GDA56_20165 [Hormoscilla sp. GM7CHS1pb]|nr:hypothetical protein [Hormoscilla sp. GM7CHS1pb]